MSCSGDIGYYEDDGHLVISDRLKELIKYKGFQVRCVAYVVTSRFVVESV